MENYMLDDIKEYLSLNLNDYGNININFEINKFILLFSSCVRVYILRKADKRAVGFHCLLSTVIFLE